MATNAAVAQNTTETKRQTAYIFSGTLAESEIKTDRNGKEYLTGKFTGKIGGKVKTVRAMAFGKAVANVNEIWKDGAARIYGLIEKANGESKGGVLRVIAPGREAKAA